MICRKFCVILLCVGLLTATSASVLKEALEEHLKDAAQNEAAESIKHDKHKGEKVHEEDSQLHDTHKNQYTKSSDEGKYVKKDHDLKSASEADSYKGYNSKQDKAEDSETTGFKRGHKKGHHKQGFQNSYHKDESSNKSTFFDDLNDEGDQASYNSRLNSHDNHGGRAYQGSHNNGQEYVRDNYHGGGYNRYGDVGNKQQDHQDHGRKYYLDDHQNYNKYNDDRNTYNRDKVHDYHQYRAPQTHRDPGWDWQRWDDRKGWDDRRGWDDGRGWDDRRGWKDRRGWEQPEWRRDQGWDNKDYGGPGYYDGHGLRHEGGYGYGPNHGYGYGYGYGESRNAPIAKVPAASASQAKNAPVVAHRKQTITIYEDPRYDGKQSGQLRREEGDYLQLEFRPSQQRYAEYDDSYYAPTREGGVESSKINRLVYNYRRQ